MGREVIDTLIVDTASGFYRNDFFFFDQMNDRLFEDAFTGWQTLLNQVTILLQGVEIKFGTCGEEIETIRNTVLETIQG
jgi:hypothetical protein